MREVINVLGMFVTISSEPGALVNLTSQLFKVEHTTS
jgi:hypothetical protein